MENIRPRHRRHRVNKLKLTLTALIFVAIIVLAVLLITGAFGNKEIKEFQSSINAGDYAAAKDIENEIRSTKTGDELGDLVTQMDNILTEDYGKLETAAKEATLSSDALTRYASINVFEAELAPKVQQTLTAAINDYLNGTITMEQMDMLCNNFKAVNLAVSTVDTEYQALSTIIAVRERLPEAEEAYNNGDLTTALEIYSSVPSEDSQNYASSMEKVASISLEMAEKQSKANNYVAAVTTINKALELLPDNAELQSALTTYQDLQAQAAANLVEYTGPIEHLFTHCLIAYPEICLEKGTDYLWVDCITPLEFTNILNALYENNYILVDINSIYYNPSGDGKTYEFAPLMLPEGKKPMVLSFDDVVYDQRKMGNGMVDKIILDENGNIATSTKMDDGTVDIAYDKEFVNILDTFVEEHPDFSLNGAKGAIALTGFDGILGYRVNRDSPNRESEIEDCTTVVAKLKENGWAFVSHTYSHARFSTVSDEKVLDDMTKFENEVENIVGPVQVLIWPYGNGNRLKVGDSGYEILKQGGYVLFCGVGGNVYNKEESDGTVFMDRRPLDGTALWGESYKERYKELFNTDAVRDPIRPRQEES